MANKQHTDRAAVQAILFNIDAIERKIRMIKQYVNPNTGTIRDLDVVTGLFNGASDCSDDLKILLAEFK